MECWSVGSQVEQVNSSHTHPSTDSDCAAISLTQKLTASCHTIIVDDGKNPTVRLSATLWDSISSNERSRASAICMTLLTFLVPLSGKEGGEVVRPCPSRIGHLAVDRPLVVSWSMKPVLSMATWYS